MSFAILLNEPALHHSDGSSKLEAVMPRCYTTEMGPATHYTLCRNTASEMKM